MADNSIALKSVKELLDYNFFIPSYQRGYRWTTQQIKELLDDIKDFTLKTDKKAGEFYCLQPIVVKKLNDNEKQDVGLDASKDWYEVIDGQQRLTSIYLILKLFKESLDALDLSTSIYSLKYEREIGQDTSALNDVEAITDVESGTIDRLHVTNAVVQIKTWRNKKKVNIAKFCNSLLYHQLVKNVDKEIDVANNVRVIWYELVDEDPISVFTRLNIGKIALTNAELIKALILNRENFKGSDGNVHKDLYGLRQREIAGKWDAIEAHLQDNAFWMFLNDADYDKPTRIDLIFDLIKEQNLLNLTDEELNETGSDKYNTFRYFYTYFADKSRCDVEQCWSIIDRFYKAFEEWYNDPELYHYIGYLLSYKSPSLADIVKAWNTAASKDAFVKYLKTKVKEHINKCPDVDFQYNVNGDNKGRCKPILLFHNIQTAINMNKNSDSKAIDMAYRFPFDAFKTEHWDVEHINSNTTNPEDDIDTQKEWLVNVFLSLPSDLQRDINTLLNSNPTAEMISEVVRKAKTKLQMQSDWSQEEKNRLWNYALLDSSTNRSYGNAIFSSKRRIIISKDSGKSIGVPSLSKNKSVFDLPDTEDASSCFVPPTTKMAFLKYYSPSVVNNNYWDKDVDAPAYLESIKDCIKQLDD